MKRLVCALLAVLMLCTITVSMVSCGVSVEGIKEKSEKLKEDGKIVSCVVVNDTVTVIGKGDLEGTLIATEYEDKDTAEKDLDKKQAAATLIGATCELKGKVIIYYTNEELYKAVT